MSIRDSSYNRTSGSPREVVGSIKETFRTQLEKTIGLSGVVIISLSAMLGSGLFVLPSLAGDMMGEGIWLAYIIAALVVLPGALSKSELASAMPTSGGDYIYIERTYGPIFGTIAGLGLWASFLLKAAFALIGFSAYLEIIAYAMDVEVNMMVISIAVLSLITLLNVMGVEKIKNFQTPIITLTIFMLVALCIAAFFTSEVDLAKPLRPSAFGGGMIGLAETAAFVFVAYAGVTKVAAIAEEVKEPGKNLPSGMMISLITATLLYSTVSFMLMATMPENWWLTSDGEAIENPIYVFAEHVGGSTVGLITAVLAVLTMVSMAMAGVLAASRYVFAMARDNLVPQLLEDVNTKYETPHWPIIITGLAMLAAILTMNVHDVVKLASGFQIMIFIVVNSCVVVLRSSRHSWYQPTYKSPLYPYVQLLGMIGGGLLVIVIGEKAFIGAGIALVVGGIIYFGYGRRHVDHTVISVYESFREQMRNPDLRIHNLRVVAFQAADSSGDGHHTLREFQHAMHVLDFKFNDNQLRDIFHWADADDDGVLDIGEFLDTFEQYDNDEDDFLEAGG